MTCRNPPCRHRREHRGKGQPRKARAHPASRHESELVSESGRPVQGGSEQRRLVEEHDGVQTMWSVTNGTPTARSSLRGTIFVASCHEPPAVTAPAPGAPGREIVGPLQAAGRVGDPTPTGKGFKKQLRVARAGIPLPLDSRAVAGSGNGASWGTKSAVNRKQDEGTHGDFAVMRWRDGRVRCRRDAVECPPEAVQRRCSPRRRGPHAPGRAGPRSLARRASRDSRRPAVRTSRPPVARMFRPRVARTSRRRAGRMSRPLAARTFRRPGRSPVRRPPVRI
jgi:hypothetical protein